MANSNIDTKIPPMIDVLATTGNFFTLANESYKDTDVFTVPITGYYLCNYKIAHCGANASGFKAGGYWTMGMYDGNTLVKSKYGLRDTISVPIASSWDQEINTTCIFYLVAGHNYKVRFRNLTGISTDSNYPSRCDAYFNLVSV